MTNDDADLLKTPITFLAELLIVALGYRGAAQYIITPREYSSVPHPIHCSKHLARLADGLDCPDLGRHPCTIGVWSVKCAKSFGHSMIDTAKDHIQSVYSWRIIIEPRNHSCKPSPTYDMAVSNMTLVANQSRSTNRIIWGTNCEQEHIPFPV